MLTQGEIAQVVGAGIVAAQAVGQPARKDRCKRRIPGVVDATPRVASMAASMASRVCGT